MQNETVKQNRNGYDDTGGIDRQCSCGVSEFDWEYTQTEKCLILEGNVTVTDNPDTGQAVNFGPGDYVVFPVGLQCVWKVTAPVRKHYNFE